jgi:nucleolar pre-ribosomal-associated protein 1
MLRLKSRIIMKLGLLTGPAVPNVLFSQCLVCLRRLEKDLTLPTVPIIPGPSSQPRHTSYTHRDLHTPDSHIVWGEVVVSLWRASMTLENSGNAWDELTPRILLWNLLVDGEDQVAEWARKEVVRNTTRAT